MKSKEDIYSEIYNKHVFSSIPENNEGFCLEFFEWELFESEYIANIDSFKIIEMIEKVSKKLLLFENINLNLNKDFDEFEMMIISNMSKAASKVIWNLFKPNKPVFIKELNKLMTENQALVPGSFRNKNIFVKGVKKEFKFLSEERIDEKLNKLLSQANNSEEIALHLLLFIITQQVFFDGNKRTAFLIANKILLENFYKFILLDETNIDKFNLLLNDLYNNFKYEKYNNLFNFLKEQIKDLK
ncbi:Fic family protein [Mesoplasma melaleucae]|uniref:Fido domain-containing protein n=1 Tax=Mesoplasma melaleucae TaxID=81459 RepID=A0A2K8NY31_9MOLU|nr:Fic family protein [Mesoplasma melaleucae]ATZ17661.1 hypothetical protein EMELA_v1c00760 [Mesoplasma melaleucae]